MAAPNPWLTAPVPLTLTCGGESVRPLHVYITLHTSTGFSLLHSAVNYDTFQTSLCLLCTQDHLSWIAEVFHMKRWRNLFPADHLTKPSFSRASFGHSGTMTPRTTNPLVVSTSQTRRYSGLSGPLRRHTQ